MIRSKLITAPVKKNGVIIEGILDSRMIRLNGDNVAWKERRRRSLYINPDVRLNAFIDSDLLTSIAYLRQWKKRKGMHFEFNV